MAAAVRAAASKAAKTILEKEKCPEIAMVFHASGLTCKQWRKLKNLWNPGRTVFRPSASGHNTSAKGPTCVLYLPSSEKLESLPSSSSEELDLLLLHGQYRSTLVDHVDVQKASDLVGESDSSLFNFYLPSSYLSYLCSRPEEFKE